MKRIVTLVSIVSFAILTPALAFAQNAVSPVSKSQATNPVLTQAAARKNAILTQGVPPKESGATNAATRSNAGNTQSLDNLKSRAVSEIDRRLTALSALLTRINALQKLSDFQKATLTEKVQTEITSLTELKVKIQADTDMETLKTDVKSIVASYRIFALFVPQVHILAAAEGMLSATDRLSSAYGELNERVDSASVAGMDTTAMKEQLVQLQANITDANAKLSSAITLVSILTPEGYPANASSLMSGRENIAAAKKEIMESVQIAKSILTLLRQGNTQIPAGNNGSGSAVMMREEKAMPEASNQPGSARQLPVQASPATTTGANSPQN